MIENKKIDKNSKSYNINIKFKSAPINIDYIDNLTKDSYTYSNSCLNRLDNTFTVFNSIDGIIYLIYSNKKKSIITYNLIDNMKINEIKNAHKKFITNFRYYLDINKKRDLIISISEEDANIKLWEINTWKCILNLENIYKMGRLYSACFLNSNNEIFIASSNNNNDEQIKIFDLNGNIIKEINETKFINVYIIDSFYDNKTLKNYIVTGNDMSLKSFDYDSNVVYKIYDAKDYCGHYNLIINEEGEKIKIIETNSEGKIGIWDFHSGDLLKKIFVDDNRLYGMCLWNNDYILVGSLDQTIKIIKLEEGKIINNLIGHKSFPLTIKKIKHPFLGECLLSQGQEKDQIKLWINLK